MPRARIGRCNGREGERVRSVHSHHHDISPEGYETHTYIHTYTQNIYAQKNSKGLEIACIIVVRYIKKYLSQLLCEPSIVTYFNVSRLFNVPTLRS
jgi:hypothetical protein